MKSSLERPVSGGKHCVPGRDIKKRGEIDMEKSMEKRNSVAVIDAIAKWYREGYCGDEGEGYDEDEE